MKVLRHNEDVLELRHQGMVWVIGLGVVQMVAALAAIFFLGRTATLTCERDNRARTTCRIEHTLLGVVVADEPLEALRGAYVAESQDSDGDITYRVMLQTGGGDVPLTSVHSSGYRGKADTAQEINTFLQNASQRHLEIKQAGTLGFIMGGSFIITGLACIILGIQNLFSAWIFDRNQGKVVHRHETLFGVRLREFDLHDIVGTLIQESTDSDGDSTYRVVLVRGNQEYIPLTKSYSSGRRGKERLSQQLNLFLSR